MSERPRGIETEKGRAPGGDKEMREQGLDKRRRQPSAEKTREERARGTGEGDR